MRGDRGCPLIALEEGALMRCLIPHDQRSHKCLSTRINAERVGARWVGGREHLMRCAPSRVGDLDGGGCAH